MFIRFVLKSLSAAALLAGLSACDTAPPSAPAADATKAAAVERFSIVSNGESVGYLVGTTEGDRVEVEYHVDNNGRGPKHREAIRLDDDGLPRAWSIEGTSLMGGPVAESFAWEDGRARWESQADRGEREPAAPALYVVNDGSPWAVGLYARALLRTPEHRLDALPGGSLQLEELQAYDAAGADGATVPVTVYRFTGLELAPSYLMLDADDRLFAVLSGSLTVREGFESQERALQELLSKLEMERAEALQRKLAHRHDGDVRIRDVRIFDPATATLGPPVSVRLRGERIAAIEAADAPAAAGERVYDGEGGTLVPGLHDMHSHTSLDSGLWYLAAGVTSTRDMGNDNDFLLDLMPRIEDGRVAGPRIVRNGFIEGRSPYSARHGFVIDSVDKGLEAVRWYAERGYWQIKIYNSMNPDWVKPLAAEAHRLGLGVTGHVPAFATPDRMIRDGYDEIAHVNQLMLGWLLDPEEDTRTPLRLTGMARAAELDLATSPRVAETLALMKRHGTALDTTAVILELLMLSRAGEISPGGEHFLDHMPIGYQRYRKRTYVSDLTPETDRAYHEAVDTMLATLKLLHDNGIRLLPGTDDGTGFTLHRELELYAKAGIPPAEVLANATLGMERYLGRADRLGSIEAGKLADFFLVAGDPTRDINAIRGARLVSKGDAIYFPAEIYTALGVRPFAEPPPVR